MSASHSRLKIGDEVRIRVWDHREGADEPQEFFIYGRVQKVTRKSITVDSWAHIDAEYADRDPSSDVIKTYTLLRTCVTEVKVFT